MATHHLSLVEADPNADEQVKDMNAFILSAANGDYGPGHNYFFLVRFIPSFSLPCVY